MMFSLRNIKTEDETKSVKILSKINSKSPSKTSFKLIVNDRCMLEIKLDPNTLYGLKKRDKPDSPLIGICAVPGTRDAYRALVHAFINVFGFNGDITKDIIGYIVRTCELPEPELVIKEILKFTTSIAEHYKMPVILTRIS